MKYISDVELMTRLENYFGPVKVDLLNNIKRIVDEMPGVTPEALENTCKQIAAVVPDLTQSIIAALPDIITNIDLCASCNYINGEITKPEFDYSSYCLNCIHETVCHSVADGFVYVPGFTCNDRELRAPVGTIESALYYKENGELVFIPLDRLILKRKMEE